MACEYQESDIMFSEHGGKGSSSCNYYIWPPQPQQKSSVDGGRMRRSNKSKKLINSLPICVPERDGDHFQWENESDEFQEEWKGGGIREVVPPHLILARRLAEKMEFSVCSGKGRTLKGRDLKEVRNEILRMTGFLED